jgi:hypothetical protein
MPAGSFVVNSAFGLEESFNAKTRSRKVEDFGANKEKKKICFFTSYVGHLGRLCVKYFMQNVTFVLYG